MTKAAALLAGLLTALAVLVPSAAASAGAATRTVHVSNNGPKPAALTVNPGDKVVFVNDDTVPHEIRSVGAWQYDSGPLPPSQTSSATPALTAPGTYRYSDIRSVVVLPQTFNGSLTVPKPRPTSTPTPTPTRTKPVVTPSATPQVTPSATPVVTPSATPRATPSGTKPPHASPTAVASQPAPSPSPSLNLLYGEPRGLVQDSPHRYGLPALVAGVAIGGVLSLLGRYLLSLPEGRRTGSDSGQG